MPYWNIIDTYTDMSLFLGQNDIEQILATFSVLDK